MISKIAVINLEVASNPVAQICNTKSIFNVKSVIPVHIVLLLWLQLNLAPSYQNVIYEQRYFVLPVTEMVQIYKHFWLLEASLHLCFLPLCFQAEVYNDKYMGKSLITNSHQIIWLYTCKQKMKYTVLTVHVHCIYFSSNTVWL